MIREHYFSLGLSIQQSAAQLDEGITIVDFLHRALKASSPNDFAVKAAFSGFAFLLAELRLLSPNDLTTVDAWAREAGMCETQLRLRCRLAGVPAKVSLDFVRALRAAFWREARGGALKDYLDVGDARTMQRLFARVGLSGPQDSTVLEYVSVQPVIRDVALIEQLKKVLTPMATLRQDDRPHH